ncbi:MAG: NAD(P)/FAD-dependent oxidoreductase [Alphaproteobacteria bacterium]|nr:NAD(P)/FAD-dependent oxidoreductase [Alphaproteobacteria bacterium]
MKHQPHITIIGTGFGGLGMAIQLLRSNIGDVHLLEKADDIGGTWRDNDYPGCACDVPSHFYSFSFEGRADWTRVFPPRDEIFAYMNGLADKYDLRQRTRFGCEAQRIVFDDTKQKWHIHTKAGEVLETDIVITATGQLNRPKMPEIAGHNDFKNPIFHSAEWDYSQSLEGKRVAVIGNGPSAAQFIPEVAKQAAQMTVFQRSPCHVAPRGDAAYSGFRKFLFRFVPFYRKLYRGLLYWSLESTFLSFNSFEKVRFLARVLNRASNFENRIAEHFDEQVQDPHLRKILKPDYPIGCKRVVISDDYYPALQRPNASVETRNIDCIVETGIRTDDGETHAFDVIIYGTGFASTEFLAPMQVVGTKGADLNKQWHEGAEAYLGITMPHFPNFFMLYGPNTNLGHNSIIFMLECQFDYILRALRALRGMNAHHAHTIDLKESRLATFMDYLKARLASSVWEKDCDSWYKNEAGRVTNNWPDFTYVYQKATQEFNLEDYDFTPAPNKIEAAE